jgi:hypothetical protein
VYLEDNQLSIDVLVSAVGLKHCRMLMKKGTDMYCNAASLDADWAACQSISHHLRSETKEKPEFIVTSKSTAFIARMQLIFL